MEHVSSQPEEPSGEDGIGLNEHDEAARGGNEKVDPNLCGLHKRRTAVVWGEREVGEEREWLSVGEGGGRVGG